MLELGSSGSVRGVLSNEHPYRHPRPFAVIRRHHADRRLRAGTGNSVRRYRRPFPLSTHAFELRPPIEMTNRTGAWMVKALSFSTIQSSSPSFRRARRGACPFRQHR